MQKRRLTAKVKLTVYVSHSIADRLDLACKVPGRNKSKFTEKALEHMLDPEQVLADPQHPYTRALLSVVPEIGGMQQQILHGETPDPRRIPDGCRFHPRCPLVRSGEAERLGILAQCQSADVALHARTEAHWVACHAGA